MSSRNWLQVVFIALTLSLPDFSIAAQSGETAEELTSSRLPYYTEDEIYVFEQATAQNRTVQEYRRSLDYERWAKSVAQIFDLAGRFDGRPATRLVIAYGRVAVDDLVVFLEEKHSHRGATVALQVLGDRIGARAFPSERYEERLRSIVEEFDSLLVQLNGTEACQSASKCRQSVDSFIRTSQMLDVESDLIRTAVEPKVDQLVDLVTNTNNALEARELLQDESLLGCYLRRTDKSALKKVVEPN